MKTYIPAQMKNRVSAVGFLALAKGKKVEDVEIWCPNSIYRRAKTA